MDITIDLHLHTAHSDGQESAEALAGRVLRSGARAFSVTEHNLACPSADLLLAVAAAGGVAYIHGIELSARDAATSASLHILAYGPRDAIERLGRAAQGTLAGYIERGRRIIDRLKREYPGIALDHGKLLRDGRAAYVSRNALGEALSAFVGADALSVREAIRLAFVEESDDWMPDAAVVTRAISDAGAVPVLAHPGTRDVPPATLQAMVARLVDAGLRGIEVWYPKHDARMRKRLQGLAARHGLLMTGGSDWHGPAFSAVDGPGVAVPAREAYRFLEAVGAI